MRYVPEACTVIACQPSRLHFDCRRESDLIIPFSVACSAFLLSVLLPLYFRANSLHGLISSLLPILVLLRLEPSVAQLSSCALATNIGPDAPVPVTSPLDLSTTDQPNDLTPSCKSSNTNAPEKIVYIDVPANKILDIRQTGNNFDSVHTMRLGPACPGTYPLNNGQAQQTVSWHVEVIRG